MDIVNEMFIEEQVDSITRYNEFRESMMLRDMHHYVLTGDLESVREGFIGDFFSGLKDLITRAWNAIKSIFTKSGKILEEKSKKIKDKKKSLTGKKVKAQNVELELYPINLIAEGIGKPLENMKIDGYDVKLNETAMRNVEEIIYNATDNIIKDGKAVHENNKKSQFNGMNTFDILHNYGLNKSIKDNNEFTTYVKSILGITKEYKFKVDLSTIDTSMENLDKVYANSIKLLENSQRDSDSWYKGLLNNINNLEKETRRKPRKEFLSKLSAHINTILGMKTICDRYSIKSLDCTLSNANKILDVKRNALSNN